VYALSFQDLIWWTDLEVSHVEDPYKTFDENEVFISALPFDEYIQVYVHHGHQEENMMSCNPFEDIDDTLFHDLGSEEGLEEPLDATNPFWKTKTNNYALMLHIILVTPMIH
jgi:hypothetical protein